MRKFLTIFTRAGFIILVLLSACYSFPHLIYADPPDDLDRQETYIRGKVLQILQENLQTLDNSKNYNESLKVQLLEGRDHDKIVTIGYSADARFNMSQKINAGEMVVVDSKPDLKGNMFYSIYEPYRLNSFWIVLAGFILLIIIIAGKKGIGALVGLCISIATISFYIVPNIIGGHDPLSTTITGAIGILILTTYIAHGISIKTTVAVISTAISLALALFLSIVCVQLMHLFGLGSEDVNALVVGTANPINAQGLLLSGILIGTLGALNDITTTQAITIFTLVKENPKQHFSHLFHKGMTIGKEHIASLINTLVLAYAGSSLAIFLFVAFNPAKLPLWVILNNESTMEEVTRSLVGSTALIIAVPITTCIGSFIALYKEDVYDFILAILR